MVELAAAKAAETAKKAAEVTRKLESAKRNLEHARKMNELNLKKGFETAGSTAQIDRYVKEVELRTQELQRLK